MREGLYTDAEVARLQASEAKLAVDGYKARLKAEFLRLLTEDSVTNDARRREFNQAIFSKESGHAVFNGTDLTMVLSKFDRAVRNLR